MRLRELRINAGLSPEGLGHKAGISGFSVRRIEQGGVPTPVVALKIASVFDMRPTELFPELLDHGLEEASK